MGKYVIELSEVEEKALLTTIIDIQTWISNTVHNRARQCIDKIVDKYSDKNYKKISIGEKNQIVRDAKIETAYGRNLRLQEELEKESEEVN